MLSFHDSSFVGTDERGKRITFADLRKQLEEGFAVFRRMNPSTVVQDARLQGDRLVVYSKTETRYEYHDPRIGWIPEIYKATGEATWEKKGGQWKLMRSTTLRAAYQVDPKWVAAQNAIIQGHYEAAKKVAESMNSNTRH